MELLVWALLSYSLVGTLSVSRDYDVNGTTISAKKEPVTAKPSTLKASSTSNTVSLSQ